MSAGRITHSFFALSGNTPDQALEDDLGAADASHIKEERSAYLAPLGERLQMELDRLFPKDIQTRIGGPVFTPVAMNDVLVENKLINIFQIAACVLLISAFVFRSLWAGVLVLIPLAATILCIFGLMGISGIPLQVVTATVAAIAVGIGADYAIYLLFRLREELAKGQAWLQFRRRFKPPGRRSAMSRARSVQDTPSS